MSEPILTLGDLEPERPTVKVRRNAPAGPWQRFKHRHFDVLLRWFPVRYQWTEHLYPMRLASEFGLAQSARLQRISADAQNFSADSDPAAYAHMVELLTEFCSLVLIAPRDVIEGLDIDQKARLAMAFQVAVMGTTPTPRQAENPSTSATSSPASAVSTAPTTG